MTKDKKTKTDLQKYTQLKRLSENWWFWLLSKTTWKSVIDLIEIMVNLQPQSEIERCTPTTKNEKFIIDQERCEKTVLDVWKRYKEQGINIQSLPSIKLVDWYNKINLRMIAFVKEEIETQKDNLIIQWRTLRKKILKEYYQLEPRENLFDEFRDYQLKSIWSQLDKLVPEASQSDIVFYTWYPSQFNETKLQSVIVHEMFHLLEQQKWIRYNPSIIREGTATYIQNLFAWDLHLFMNKTQDYNTMVYWNMAYYIHKFFGEIWETKSVQAVLTWKYKTEIESLYAEKIQPLVDWYSVDLEHHHLLTKNVIQQNLLNNPDYSQFVANPTIDNLLTTFTNCWLQEYSQWLSTQSWKERILQTYIECLNEVKDSIWNENT